MGINNNSTLCYSLEEIFSGQVAVIVEIKKFKCFKKHCIVTNLRRSLKLYLIFKFAFKPTIGSGLRCNFWFCHFEMNIIGYFYK